MDTVCTLDATKTAFLAQPSFPCRACRPCPFVPPYPPVPTLACCSPLSRRRCPVGRRVCLARLRLGRGRFIKATQNSDGCVCDAPRSLHTFLLVAVLMAGNSQYCNRGQSNGILVTMLDVFRSLHDAKTVHGPSLLQFSFLFGWKGPDTYDLPSSDVLMVVKLQVNAPRLDWWRSGTSLGFRLPKRPVLSG